MHTSEKAVQKALSAARARDWPRALEALLAAWREGHHPLVADTVEAVSSRIERPPIDLAGRTEQAAWLARAGLNDPADLPVLLERLVATRAKQTRARLNAIADQDDPRILRVLQDHLSESPYRARTGEPYLRRLISVLAASQSTEAHGALRARAEAIRGFPGPVGLWSAREVLDSVGTLPELAEPSIEDGAREALKQIVQRAAAEAAPPNAKTVGSLLAAVYRDPTDRAPRAVLADVLIEAGDPRGHFIAAQLSRDPEARPGKEERRLLKQWERTWLAEVEGFIARDGHEWRDGFPYRLRVGKAEARAELLNLPLWSTVAELDVRPYTWTTSILPLLFSPQMKSLRAVWSLSMSQLFELRGRDS